MFVLILVIIPVIISIIVIIVIIIIIPISIVLPLFLVVLPLLLVMLPLLVVLVMLARLSWSVSFMSSVWPSRSSVVALRARAALVVSPVMLWLLGVNMAVSYTHLTLPPTERV